MNKKIAQITVLTSKRPKVLTKQIFLNDEGSLIKKPSAQLVEGDAEVIEIRSMEEFSQLLQKMKTNQALVYGTPKGTLSQAKVVTKNVFDCLENKEGTITRTNSHLRWSNGAGIMMFDYDPDDDTLSMDEVLQVLYEVCPEIQDTDHLWWTSSSSNIFNDETGQELTGVNGQRIYLMVEDASDIPRAAKVIEQRLWLAGHGRFKISNSGSLLERVSFDMSVYQPSRLDFAAGASTSPPLSQKRGAPVLKKGTKSVLKTSECLPNLRDTDWKNIETTKIGQEALASKEAVKIREQFTSNLAKDIAERFEDLEQASIKVDVSKALDDHVLPPYWPLYILKENSIIQVDVETVLAKKFTFHECLCLDPIDPDYDNGRLVGKLYLLQDQPRINSFARGGYVCDLSDCLYQIYLHAELNKATSETLGIIENREEVFTYGNSLALPINNKLHSMDRIMMKNLLSGLIKYRAKRDFCDPSNDLVENVLSHGSKMNINPVTGFVDHPIIDSKFKMFWKQGYNKEMEILGRFDHEEFDFTDERLSSEDVLHHFERIMAPFTEFDIAGPDDQSVLMGAIFSAVLRQVLPTCPVFGFDAPMQGTGKTLLAETIAVIASGSKAPALAPGQSDSDEEFRKRLLTILLEGANVCLLDNIVGEFDSPSLAAAITSGVYQDRILRTSRSPKVLVKMLFLITGNNLRFKGDMNRRVLKIRLKPKDDQLAKRVYSFDPIEKATAMRKQVISSVLSLVNHWKHSGKVMQPGSMTSFNEWDTLVRQPLAFLGQELPQTGLVDLLDVSTRQQADSGDKESLIALLIALASCFGDEQRFKANDVFRHFRADGHSPLADAILAFKKSDSLQSSQHIGNLLRDFVDRNVEGVVLSAKKVSGSWSYWVEFTEDTHRPEVVASFPDPRVLRVSFASSHR